MDADIPASRINENTQSVAQESDRGVITQINRLAAHQAIGILGKKGNGMLKPAFDHIKPSQPGEDLRELFFDDKKFLFD